VALFKANAFLRSTTSVIAYAVLAQAVMAQDADFLGTIQLGESKREVQTDTAIAITEVDQEEIDDRQADSIAELVDSVPGVTLVNAGTPKGAGINIRGFGANGTYGTDQKVAVVVDGASVGSEEIYRVATQLFTDPALYRSVSVIRGTVGSFAYGSGIIGGVVQLDTVDASDFTDGQPGFKVRETLQYSTNGDGLTSSTILAWQPTQNFEFLANYTSRKQSDQIDGSGTVRDDTAFDLPSGLVKGRFTFGADNDQSVTVSYSDTTTDEKDVPYDTFNTTSNTFGNVDRRTQSRTAVIAYDYAPVGNDLIDLTATLSYADQKIDQESNGAIPVTNADLRYETLKFNVTNTSLFTTGAIDHTLLAGFEVLEKKRLNAASAYGGTDRRFAIFAVDEMQIGDAWTFTPAVRFETSHIVGSTAPNNGTYDNNALMGGVSARYQFQNGFAVFGSAAYTENLPILDDLNNTTYMSQSEKSTTYELGASYDGVDVFSSGDELSLKANVYQTTTTDITSYSGVAEVKTEGVELEAAYAHSQGYYLDANANFARGDDFTSAGVKTDWDNTPANSLRMTVGRKFGRELDLSWEAVANFKDVRTTSTATTTTPGFLAHNLRATYIPQSGILEDTEIRFGIENVFNLDYKPLLSTRKAAGRNIKLTVSHTF